MVSIDVIQEMIDDYLFERETFSTPQEDPEVVYYEVAINSKELARKIWLKVFNDVSPGANDLSELKPEVIEHYGLEEPLAED